MKINAWVHSELVDFKVDFQWGFGFAVADIWFLPWFFFEELKTLIQDVNHYYFKNFDKGD